MEKKSLTASETSQTLQTQQSACPCWFTGFPAHRAERTSLPALQPTHAAQLLTSNNRRKHTELTPYHPTTWTKVGGSIPYLHNSLQLKLATPELISHALTPRWQLTASLMHVTEFSMIRLRQWLRSVAIPQDGKNHPAYHHLLTQTQHFFLPLACTVIEQKYLHRSIYPKSLSCNFFFLKPRTDTT